MSDKHKRRIEVRFDPTKIWTDRWIAEYVVPVWAPGQDRKKVEPLQHIKASRVGSTRTIALRRIERYLEQEAAQEAAKENKEVIYLDSISIE